MLPLMVGIYSSPAPTPGLAGLEEVPKDWNSPQLESRVIQTRGTLRTQPNNTNSNDTGNGNYKNIGHDSVIMPILIMMKRKREQEEEGIREEEDFHAPFPRCRN